MHFLSILRVWCLGFVLMVVPVQVIAKPAIHFKDVTIVIPAFDRYKEVWPGFFTLLFRQWPSLMDGANRDIPILFTTQHEQFKHPRVTTLALGDDASWSTQMLSALQHVHTKHVLILLEDYWMTEPVNEERLREAFRVMKAQNAAYVEVGPEIYHMNGIPKGWWGGIEASYEYETAKGPLPEGVVFKKKFSDYRIALQACIWNKKDLAWLLKPGESAWNFEQIGNMRSQGIDKPFLGMLEPHPFEYYNVLRRGRIMQGTTEVAEKMGIEFKPTRLKYRIPGGIKGWIPRIKEFFQF